MNYEIFYGIGAVILGLGIAWAIFDSKRRNRANDPITEEATRKQYDQPSRYDDEIRPQMERKLKS
jgi:hypothetical protein